ncbi:MAG TPA: protein-tyrosine-phosphatase [Phycisphaerae bacterium]|nr:protein-tyrosine-phosphatase [Phycisphaerae bacterium]HUT61853.1 protein-tyrosine-phosphatase [Phycisphaerae bacterium]
MLDSRPLVLMLPLLALATGCPSGSPERPGSPTTKPAYRHLAGVPEFAQVDSKLYRGAQPTREGFAQLARMGIRTIVCLRVLDTDRRKIAGMGFRYLHISFKHVHPEEEDVLEFLKTVTDPGMQPVFVHCRSAADRTGMMVAVYRIVVQGWPKPQAMAEMKQMGFHEIWEPIEDYIEDLDVEALRAKLPGAPAPGVEHVP